MHRKLMVLLMAAAVLVAGAGAAIAGVSDGNYNPSRQGCSGDAADSEHPDRVESGCQNFTTSVSDGSGHEVVRWGLPQLKDGDSPDPSSATYQVNPDGF